MGMQKVTKRNKMKNSLKALWINCCPKERNIVQVELEVNIVLMRNLHTLEWSKSFGSENSEILKIGMKTMSSLTSTITIK